MQRKRGFLTKVKAVRAAALLVAVTFCWMLAPALGASDAASAPTNVTVTNATGVTGTGATLNGTLNPSGAATTYQFEYGTTTSYGSVTAQFSAGDGTAIVSVNTAVSGLQPGTLFHFALIATNSAGTTTSGDGTFTTPSAPAISTPTASGIDASSATLNGTVNPSGATVTDCHFDFGTTNAYGSAVSCSPAPGSGTTDVPVSGALTALLPGTTYHFRLVATNSVNTSDSNDQTFSTAALQPTVTASLPTSVTSTGATLNGAVNPNGADTTYFFEFGATTAYGQRTAQQDTGAGTSATAAAAVLSALQPGATIHWRLVASNSAGKSFSSDQTLTLPSAAPAVITTTGVALTDMTAMLSGSVNPNGADTTYRFDYGLTTAYGQSTASTDVGSGTNVLGESADIAGLAPGTTYHFRIEATNSNGTSLGLDQTFTTLPAPPTVATLPANAITSTAATVNGTVNPNGADTSYHFEFGLTTSYGQSTTAEDAGSGNSSVNVSANLSDLQPGATYHFRLVATNPGGTGFGADMTFTVLECGSGCDHDSGVALTDTTATLNGSVNPNGADTTYRFDYGLTTAYGQSTASTDIGSGTNLLSESADIAGLAPGTTYHFRIEATNSNGTSLGLDQTFTTLPAPPTVATLPANAITSTAATVNGTVNPNGADTSYHFEFGLTTSYGQRTSADDAGSGNSAVNVSANLSGLQPGATYHFRLVATNPGGTGFGADMTFTASSAAPAVITTAGVALTDTTAMLSGSVNPNGADTTYRFDYGLTTAYGQSTASTDVGSGTNVLGESADIAGLAPGTTYHFRIEATNSNGTSLGLDQTFTTLPAPPTVATLPANAITSTAATVNGTVNPNGADTSYHFEFGLTTSYGQSTSAEDAGSGNSAVNVSANLSGLQPGRDVSLPSGGDKPRRDRVRGRHDVHGLKRGADRDHRAGRGHHPDDGDAERVHQPQRRRHGLQLRLGHHDELRSDNDDSEHPCWDRPGHGVGRDHGAYSRDDVSLPDRRDEWRREPEPRTRRVIHDRAGPAGCRHTGTGRDHFDHRHPQRLCQSQWRRYELPLRVRHDDRLRSEHADPGCRPGHEPDRRQRALVRSHAGNDVPLPDRRHQLRWDEIRRRHDVCDRARRARRDHGGGLGSPARLGTAVGDDQSPWRRHDVCLRVRNHDRVRPEHRVGGSELRYVRPAGGHRIDRAIAGNAVPLPGDRDQFGWHDCRRRSGV